MWRIIPAYAGSTAAFPRRAMQSSDHPRIRGEHTPSPRRAARRTGSSPHTRGAHQERLRRHQRRRIIPAYAGSTSGIPKAACSNADHPRIRGEHPWSAPSSRALSGSSPHTRGAPSSRMNSSKISGIIPAYAGSTRCRCRFPASRRDHPRIRGEHSLRIVATPRRRGSSPHTRGAPSATRTNSRNSRIIPAYAGSTVSPGSIVAGR